MRRLSVAFVVALCIGTVLVRPADAASTNEKLLGPNATYGCDGTALTGNTGHGYAQLTTTPTRVRAAVHLRHAGRHRRFAVRLIQVQPGDAPPNGADCFIDDGRFRTDGRGAGGTTVAETRITGATSFFVVLDCEACTKTVLFVTADAVPLS